MERPGGCLSILFFPCERSAAKVRNQSNQLLVGERFLALGSQRQFSDSLVDKDVQLPTTSASLSRILGGTG